MRPHTVELRGLHLISLLKIRETLFDKRLRHVGARDIVRGSKQHRATRNSYAQIVRFERHRCVHFSQAALPHFAAVLHVALLERLARLVEQTSSVPHHCLGLFRIFREHRLADLHSLFERGGIAREAGEEIVSHLIVEAILTRQQAGAQ